MAGMGRIQAAATYQKQTAIPGTAAIRAAQRHKPAHCIQRSPDNQ